MKIKKNQRTKGDNSHENKEKIFENLEIIWK